MDPILIAVCSHLLASVLFAWKYHKQPQSNPVERSSLSIESSLSAVSLPVEGLDVRKRSVRQVQHEKLYDAKN